MTSARSAGPAPAAEHGVRQVGPRLGVRGAQQDDGPVAREHEPGGAEGVEDVRRRTVGAPPAASAGHAVSASTPTETFSAAPGHDASSATCRAQGSHPPVSSGGRARWSTTRRRSGTARASRSTAGDLLRCDRDDVPHQATRREVAEELDHLRLREPLQRVAADERPSPRATCSCSCAVQLAAGRGRVLDRQPADDPGDAWMPAARTPRGGRSPPPRPPTASAPSLSMPHRSNSGARSSGP